MFFGNIHLRPSIAKGDLVLYVYDIAMPNVEEMEEFVKYNSTLNERRTYGLNKLTLMRINACVEQGYITFDGKHVNLTQEGQGYVINKGPRIMTKEMTKRCRESPEIYEDKVYDIRQKLIDDEGPIWWSTRIWPRPKSLREAEVIIVNEWRSFMINNKMPTPDHTVMARLICYKRGIKLDEGLKRNPHNIEIESGTVEHPSFPT